MKKSLLLSVAALALPTSTRAQVASVSAATIAGQVALGLVGMPVGFVAGGLITRSIARSVGADNPSDVAMVGAYTGAALTTAIGPTILASRGAARASYPMAVGGAVAGGVGSYLLVRLNTRGDEDARGCGVFCKASAVAIVLLPSVGATIAANASRR